MILVTLIITYILVHFSSALLLNVISLLFAEHRGSLELKILIEERLQVAHKHTNTSLTNMKFAQSIAHYAGELERGGVFQSVSQKYVRFMHSARTVPHIRHVTMRTSSR